jgi:hypothetical protein
MAKQNLDNRTLPLATVLTMIESQLLAEARFRDWLRLKKLEDFHGRLLLDVAAQKFGCTDFDVWLELVLTWFVTRAGVNRVVNVIVDHAG